MGRKDARPSCLTIRRQGRTRLIWQFGSPPARVAFSFPWPPSGHKEPPRLPDERLKIARTRRDYALPRGGGPGEALVSRSRPGATSAPAAIAWQIPRVVKNRSRPISPGRRPARLARTDESCRSSLSAEDRDSPTEAVPANSPVNWLNRFPVRTWLCSALAFSCFRSS